MFGVGDGQVLDSVIMVGDQAGQVAAVAVSGPDGLIDGVDDELAGHRGRDRPAQDPSGVGVDDERGVAPARPRRDICEVGDPEPVRGERGGSCGSPGRAAWAVRGSLIVVRLTLPRTAPASPSSPMSRSTVQRAIGAIAAARCRLSVSQIFRAPNTP